MVEHQQLGISIRETLQRNTEFQILQYNEESIQHESVKKKSHVKLCTGIYYTK